MHTVIDSRNYNPLVSIVIPNYNYAKYLRKCIESTLNQSYPNTEIILIDDGSTDNSLEIAREFSHVIRIITQPNMGVNAARNRGLAISNGEYVALCDSDDLWSKNKIALQVKELQSDPKVVLVHSSYHLMDECGKLIGFKQASYSGDLAIEFILKPSSALTGPPSGVMFKKIIDGEQILFDEQLKGNAEDWDFFRRICQKGTVKAISNPQLFYRVHPDSRASRNLETYYLGNTESLKKAILDPFYGWNYAMKFRFVFRFELSMAKSYLKTGYYFAGLKHLVKAYNPFNHYRFCKKSN